MKVLIPRFTAQKQPPEVFCKESYSQKFCNIHRKAPVLESLFNKASPSRPTTLLKRDFNTGVFLLILRNF